MAKSRPILIRVRQEALDDEDFPLGVIRLGPDRSVTSFNRALAQMIGADLQPGMPVRDLPLDVLSQVTIDAELQSRYAQERGGGYTLVLKRSDTQAEVHTRVAALPEYDADGQVKGSIAFVVDDTLKNVSTAMYHAMQVARVAKGVRAGTELLQEVTRLLHDLLPFDSLMVTVIGKDRKHLRSLFESPEPPPLPVPFRWWPMPEFVQRLVSDLRSDVIDLDVLYAQPDFEELVANDEATRKFRERGFRSCLRFNVHSRGEQVAIVSLLRLRGEPDFRPEDIALCESLPVSDAVGLAMGFDAQEQHQVFLALEGRLTKLERGTLGIAQWLVDRLRRHCKWEHVSLFRVAEDRGRVRLVCQAREQDSRLPDDFELSVSKGVLGRCVRTGRTVNVPDVARDPEYEIGIESTRSELVVPLGGERVHWLLNIEATSTNAFGAEEQRAVERLMRVAATVLGRAAAREMQAEVMDNVGDAIILTSDTNIIRDVNRACTRLLKFEREEMLGQDLMSFLPVVPVDGTEAAEEGREVQPWEEAPTGIAQVEEKAACLIRSEVRASEVVRLRRKDGGTVPVLMSAATTPGMFGGKVFIASDLSNKQYLDRVSRLVPIFRQLASEIRVPLALASTFLQGTDTAGDKLEKARLQIRKADVSLARVMHAASAADGAQLERTTFPLESVVARLKQNLPQAQAEALHFGSEAEEPVYVNGAFEQLLFCVDSLLAHLLRAHAPDQHIEVRTGVAEAGPFIGLALGGTGGDVAHRRIKDVMLVDAIVPSLMERMGGRYQPPSTTHADYRLVLSSAG